ncbi:uncharacterized protein [Onthophagus taurus]|uniref:uncharacterized protein n=1 Tax=Onthophagus taurus TaxID=166361 RepID=UPI000C209B35|nr:uncharacterized protein LOC111421249 [Onthophagus taurus]
MNFLRIALVLLMVFSAGLLCCAGKLRDHREWSGEYFCRTRPFAPRCRGAAGSKRDLQKLEPLLEEPRPRDYQLNDKYLNEYELNTQRLDSLIPKVNTKTVEELDEYI